MRLPLPILSLFSCTANYITTSRLASGVHAADVVMRLGVVSLPRRKAFDGDRCQCTGYILDWSPQVGLG